MGLDPWFCPEGAECLKRLTREAVGAPAPLGTEAARHPVAAPASPACRWRTAPVLALPACLAEAYPGCGGDDAGGRDPGSP